MTLEAYDHDMRSFTDIEIKNQALDWHILRDGGISLYLRSAYLEEDVEWLHSRGYEIKEFDSGTWICEAAMHDALAFHLSFPPYYGKNLDALNDCMSEDLAVPLKGGLVLVLKHFNRFAAVSDIARTVLRIFATASRCHMLSGRRLIALIQSDDPRLSFDGLGAVHATWNSREWLWKDRGL